VNSTLLHTLATAEGKLRRFFEETWKFWTFAKFEEVWRAFLSARSLPHIFQSTRGHFKLKSWFIKPNHVVAFLAKRIIRL
jgi:hypothetical protein